MNSVEIVTSVTPVFISELAIQPQLSTISGSATAITCAQRTRCTPDAAEAAGAARSSLLPIVRLIAPDASRFITV